MPVTKQIHKLTSDWDMHWGRNNQDELMESFFGGRRVNSEMSVRRDSGLAVEEWGARSSRSWGEGCCNRTVRANALRPRGHLCHSLSTCLSTHTHLQRPAASTQQCLSGRALLAAGLEQAGSPTKFMEVHVPRSICPNP